MAAPLHYTADMVRHLNDLHDWRWPRYEVVDGKLLVTPAPRRWHQEIVRRLLVARTREWREMDQLLLVIEVLSMSTARGDRLVKRRLYQRHGVPLYWLIDADAKLAEVGTPTVRKAHIERDGLAWHPTGASAPLTLHLEELFRPI